MFHIISMLHIDLCHSFDHCLGIIVWQYNMISYVRVCVCVLGRESSSSPTPAMGWQTHHVCDRIGILDVDLIPN